MHEREEEASYLEQSRAGRKVGKEKVSRAATIGNLIIQEKSFVEEEEQERKTLGTNKSNFALPLLHPERFLPILQ